jgi:hypothetical protein
MLLPTSDKFLKATTKQAHKYILRFTDENKLSLFFSFFFQKKDEYIIICPASYSMMGAAKYVLVYDNKDSIVRSFDWR